MKAFMKIRYFGLLFGVLLILTGGINLALLAKESISEKEEETEIRQLLLAEPLTEETDKEILPKFTTLYGLNKDLVGWLSIEGTRIDYPVMQSSEDYYYLRRNFYKEDDRYGTLFVKSAADVFTPDDNFVIYGHNMKDGAMFGTLQEYGDEEYFREHPTILFDTLYEERTYEILSVFRSKVYDEDEDAFKYYEPIRIDSEDAFNDFYDNIKALSLYDTGVEAAYGDTFLTLSTCDYYMENGRFVVVAKAHTVSY